MQNIITDNLCKVSRRRARDRNPSRPRPRGDLGDRDLKKRVSSRVSRPSLKTPSLLTGFRIFILESFLYEVKRCFFNIRCWDKRVSDTGVGLVVAVEFALHPQHETSLDSRIQIIKDLNYFKNKSRKRPRSLSMVSLNSNDWEEY